jgi:hypothetical protein
LGKAHVAALERVREGSKQAGPKVLVTVKARLRATATKTGRWPKVAVCPRDFGRGGLD